jgi:hypothetical protein
MVSAHTRLMRCGLSRPTDYSSPLSRIAPPMRMYACRNELDLAPVTPRPIRLDSTMVWAELKIFLTELRDQRPGMLVRYPDLNVDDGRWPPFQIQLATSGVAAAEELHRRFGSAVELTVGALPFPPLSRPQRLRRHPSRLSNSTPARWPSTWTGRPPSLPGRHVGTDCW